MDESEPIVPDLVEPAPEAGRSRRWVGPLVSATVVLALSVGAVVVLGGGEASPERQLQATQAFVAEQKTVHFEGMSETVSVRGGLEEEPFRSTMSGDLVFPGQGRTTTVTGTSTMETLITREGYWLRPSEQGDTNDRQWWFQAHPPGLAPGEAATPAPPGLAPGEAATPAPPAGDGFFAEAGPGRLLPSAGDVTAVVARLKSPERVSANVIRARMGLRELWGPLPEEYEQFMPDGTATIELTSGPDGRLDRMVIRTEETEQTFGVDGQTTEGPQRSVDTNDLRFSRWGAPVDLTPPPPSAVDPTPGIDEEALGRFDAYRLLVPRTLPAGMELTSAQIVPGSPWASDSRVGDDCPTVALTWSTGDTWAAASPTEALEAGSIAMFANAVCDGTGSRLPVGLPGIGSDGEPFVAGPRTGRLISDPNYQPGAPFPETRNVTFGVDNVDLTFSSDLPLDQLRPILADLVPFDLRTQPIRRSEPPAG